MESSTMSVEFSYSTFFNLSYPATYCIIGFLLSFLIAYLKMPLKMCSHLEDMTGKTVLITGATAGIGKATAMELARRNARVILACRNLKKAQKVVKEIESATGNPNLEIKHLDLTDFESVRKCAQDVLDTEKSLHVLINNAGIGDFDLQITKDGCEKVMQANHLGHFLLTLLLLDLLKKSAPSRIVNVASFIYLFGILNVDDMDGRKHKSWMLAIGNLYSRSKVANILFTRELAWRLAGTGVTVNAVHPGMIRSRLFLDVRRPIAFFFRLMIFLFGKSSLQGAQTTIYVATHPKLEKTTGKFFFGCKERMLFNVIGKVLDRKLGKKLFAVSEKITGVSYEKT